MEIAAQPDVPRSDGEAAKSVSRIEILDGLRGLAALAVAWFHFTTNGPSDAVRASGQYGWLGVHVFFVVSGFVVPYSMHAAGYRIRHFHSFIARRLLRLDPPYLLTIALVILLAYASAATPGFRGSAPQIGVGQVLAHLGYANAFVGLPWLTPVFWTLGIEFQFYVTVALVFPLVASSSARVRFTVVVLLGLLPLVCWRQKDLDHHLIVAHLPQFLLGVLAFQFVALRASGRGVVGLASLVSVVGFATRPLETGVAVTTAICLVVWRGYVPPRLLLWLGSVSYSLYLLHVPLGGRVINLGARLEPTALNVALALLGAVAVSLLGAAIMHRWVEAPAQRWSRSIRP